MHQKRFFSFFYVHFGRQSGAQGRPKAGPREPEGLQRSPKASPGTSQKHAKVVLCVHAIAYTGTRFQGVPPRTGNDIKIDEKTIKKASIPLCFLNICGATIGDTVPQKGEHSVLVLTHCSCKIGGIAQR